jgi:FKBP-type peptidyl-prolyl cis-trans isomerase FklB
MKLCCMVVLCIGLLASQVTAQKKTALKNKKDKVSYSVGVNIGKNLKNQMVDVDAEILAKGLKDELSDAKLSMTEEEMQATMEGIQKELMEKQQERAKTLGDKNKKEGDAFLAANKSKEGVVTLPSGLQYKILKAGTGPIPKAEETVTANYRGTLINGKEFDNSYKRGKPLTRAVNGVIKGMTEALLLMPVGSKWQLFIPPDLAYGEHGYGADIGPYATLIFELELLSVK